MAQLCSVARLAGSIRCRFLSTLTISVTLLWPSLMVMAITHGTSPSYPHIDLVEAVIAAPRDFGGDNTAFVEASDWFMDKLLSESPNALAPYLCCAEWGRGREVLGSLEDTFSRTSIHPVSHSQDHGSCFVVSASTEMFTSSVLDTPGLISAGPLHPALKLSLDLLDHKLEEASSREDGQEYQDFYTPLRTTSGESMKLDNTHGLSVRLTPGALSMHSEHSGANGIIANLLEDMMSDDFDMNVNSYWSDTEGSHLEGRGAYLAREWSRAASVVHGLASDRQRPVGSVCGYNRMKLTQADDDLILVEGMDHLLPKTAVALEHKETMTACFMGLLSHLAAKPEVLRVTPRHKRELLNSVGSAITQSATPSTTPFEGTGLDGTGEVIQVVDSGLDETSCFFADEDGLEVEHGHLFHGLRRDPDGPIQGFFANWTLVRADFFPYDISRRKVVQYIELFNTGDQAEGEGESFGLDDSFFNFSEVYYFDYLEDDTMFEDDTDDYTWWTTSNSTEDASTSSYTSTDTWYYQCVEYLEDYFDYSDYYSSYYSYDYSSDSYSDYYTYYYSSGGFHKDLAEGHGTHVAGTAAGNARGSTFTTQSCSGNDSVPACTGGCISPSEVTEYIANDIFNAKTNCPAYECDGEGLDSPSCLGEDAIETLVDNGGMAPKAQIAFFDVSFGGFSFYVDLASNFLWNATFGTGAMIHSNSWGGSSLCQVTEREFIYDTFMYENPEHLLIFAAGNDGGLKDVLPEGDCTILSPALGKNVLAVGSTSAGASSPTLTGADGRLLYEEIGLYNYTADGLPWICFSPSLGLPSTSTEPADIDTLSFFSSYGPTLDGRIKPEVVAPGDQLLSASSDGTVDHSCEMFYSAGTSMATPLVAGAAAIVRQYFRDPSFYVHHLEAKGFCESGSIFSCIPFGPSAATVKAMLINSANLMGGSTEPDGFRGFGRVHLEAGLPLGSNDSLVLFVAEASLESNGQTKYAFKINEKAGLDLRASISWLDIPTTALSSQQLQHDLDLSVTSPSGDVYTMWSSGAKDTVNVNERVIVPPELYEDGIYTITVSAAELLTVNQAYSLVVTGAILDGSILDGEATCSNGLPGVQLDDVCCGEECGVCGGTGCGSRPGGKNVCCSSRIRDSGIVCSESGTAPCIIGELRG